VVAERRHDDSEERRRLELGTRAEEGERELKSKGERCGVLWGGARLLLGPGSAREAATGGNQWWLMALTPLMAGRG
jgi:hypothetical protein